MTFEDIFIGIMLVVGLIGFFFAFNMTPPVIP